MKPVAVVFPVLPGKSKQARDLAKAVKGKYAKEFVTSEKKQKISREMWFIQTTPMGDFLIDYLEAANPEKAFMTFVKSKDKYDVWMKGQMKKITGIDMNNPADGPLPEMMLNFPF